MPGIYKSLLAPISLAFLAACWRSSTCAARGSGDSTRASVPVRVYDFARGDVAGCGGEVFCVKNNQQNLLIGRGVG
jgi:hypothetical protein